ncbi:hypothetical protein QTP88_004923 [Uroleucon formosanum]
MGKFTLTPASALHTLLGTIFPFTYLVLFILIVDQFKMFKGKKGAMSSFEESIDSLNSFNVPIRCTRFVNFASYITLRLITHTNGLLFR